MKRKLLLLHGALGSQDQFKTLTPLLESNFDVYTFNFKGHGDKVSDKAFSIELFAQNVISFLQENQIECANIFGFSMGGYVALHLAKQFPEMVKSIVTLGTKFDWTPASAQIEIKMLNPTVIEEKVPKFARHLEAMHAPNDWKQLLHKTAQMMVDLGAQKILDASTLASIQQPVSISIGSLDK
ncbi:MAG: alpha/beta fold hydrolase, partial [Bacteroidota bacterium]